MVLQESFFQDIDVLQSHGIVSNVNSLFIYVGLETFNDYEFEFVSRPSSWLVIHKIIFK